MKEYFNYTETLSQKMESTIKKGQLFNERETLLKQNLSEYQELQ